MPDRIRLYLGGALGLALVVGALWSWSCVSQRRAVSLAAQASQAESRSVAAVAKAEVHDQAARAMEPQLHADSDEVTRLRTELARLRKASQRPGDEVPQKDPGPQPASLPVDLAPLVAKQDELIRALGKENEDLKTQVKTLTLARDSWKAAHDDQKNRANLQEMALRAQMEALKAERWKGRIEGLAVGLAIGYVGGRAR